MQYSLTGELGSCLERIEGRLRRSHGPLSDCDRLDPVSQLVLSLIGARTEGEVSLTVFIKLRDRFQSWGGLLDLSDTALTQCLQPVTYHERKAAQLREALRIIADRSGSMVLDFLEGWPVEDAQGWLRKLPGVGPKVSAAILNFSTLRKRILVVDCHHFRVAKRLGLLTPKTRFPAAQRIVMNQHIPNNWTADDLDDHHRLMKRHGQTFCPHSWPLCGKCPLQDICPTAGTRGSAPHDDDCPDEAYGSDERFEQRPAKLRLQLEC